MQDMLTKYIPVTFNSKNITVLIATGMSVVRG